MPNNPLGQVMTTSEVANNFEGLTQVDVVGWFHRTAAPPPPHIKSGGTWLMLHDDINEYMGGKLSPVSDTERASIFANVVTLAAYREMVGISPATASKWAREAAAQPNGSEMVRKAGGTWLVYLPAMEVWRETQPRRKGKQ